MADGRINSTINQLGAFTNEVSAQRGKKIMEAAADDLIAQAQTIIALLSATPTPELTMTPVEETPTLVNTETPLPAGTPTELPTLTPTLFPTETMTEIPSPTFTFTPSLTPTETLIPTETFTPLPTATEIPPVGPLTISYTYDALHRLKSAVYSDGRSFSYIYDAAGNTLQASDETTSTNYTYDAANQLLTAEMDGTVWQYEYDGNGSLIKTLPNGDETNGAKRYTYNVAGYLTKVESHNGSSWVDQAEMTYNGFGVRMTSSALGVTTEYASDGQTPLTISSGGKTTEVLYGLGPVAEKTDEWNYVLSDGINVPRQLTDNSGLTTLSVRYNPWGKPIETSGTGNFDASFIGTLIDATTGLIYVGNGQYYDPETGRFLTRGVNPNSTNPYVPWNPIGMMLGPLAIVSMLYSQKKVKNRKIYLALLVLLFVALACDLPGCPDDSATPAPEQTDTPVASETPTPGTTPTATPEPTESPIESPNTPTPCTDCGTPTPSPMPTPTPSLEQLYRITFTESGKKWEAQDKDSAIRAVDAVAHKFAEIFGGTAADAWAATYEYITFQMGGCTGCKEGAEAAGHTRGTHDIDFAGLSNADIKGRNMVVHELGHAFKWLLWYQAGIDVYGQLGSWRGSHPGYPDRPDWSGPSGSTGCYCGFATRQNQTTWQVSLQGEDGEEYADQFLGWTFNTWEVVAEGSTELTEDGKFRADMMEENMPNWVRLAAGP